MFPTLLLLVSACLSDVMPVQPPQDFKIDLAPLKAPLEKAAAQLERGVNLAESARGDLFAAVNWALAGAAALLTALLLHVIQLHGLAAAKANSTSG